MRGEVGTRLGSMLWPSFQGSSGLTEDLPICAAKNEPLDYCNY
jgi:hypothetical protein